MNLLIVWIVWAVFGCGLIVGAKVFGKQVPEKNEYGELAWAAWAPKVVKWGGVVVIAFLAINVVKSVVVVVPPTHAAVMKNELHGTARYASPGWRFVNPIIEKVEVYDMRLQEFQIGTPNEMDSVGNIVKMTAVDAGSNSPGLPLVYLVVTSRVKYSAEGCPGPECDLVDIELRYGKGKWSELVKDRMEMNAREVAGRNPYDYVGKNRDAFAGEVSTELEDDMDGLAEFAYVGIPWYDFSTFINEQLDQVAERERELERRAQDVEVAKQEQEKQRVEQQTAVMVAEQQAKVTITRAEAAKQSSILQAEGEAKALELVGTQLKANPLLIEFTKAQGWNGALPQFMGMSPVPFLDIGQGDE